MFIRICILPSWVISVYFLRDDIWLTAKVTFFIGIAISMWVDFYGLQELHTLKLIHKCSKACQAQYVLLYYNVRHNAKYYIEPNQKYSLKLFSLLNNINHKKQPFQAMTCFHFTCPFDFSFLFLLEHYCWAYCNSINPYSSIIRRNWC